MQLTETQIDIFEQRLDLTGELRLSAENYKALFRYARHGLTGKEPDRSEVKQPGRLVKLEAL